MLFRGTQGNEILFRSAKWRFCITPFLKLTNFKHHYLHVSHAEFQEIRKSMWQVRVGKIYTQKQNTDFTASTFSKPTNGEECYRHLCWISPNSGNECGQKRQKVFYFLQWRASFTDRFHEIRVGAVNCYEQPRKIL